MEREYSVIGKPAFLVERRKGRKGAEFPLGGGEVGWEKREAFKKRRDRMEDYDKTASH